MNNIILKPGKEESLLRFHPWIFSGAIHSITGEPTEGEIVDVLTSDRKFIARGHYQVGSIAVRVLSFRQEDINNKWWENRIKDAYDLRQAVGLTFSKKTNCYRLIHGEGDYLPGLVVDIYDRTAIIQCHSVGMYVSRKEIADAIITVYDNRIDAIYDKSSQTVPFMAGLDAVDGYLWVKNGDAAIPDEHEVIEGGHKFMVDWERGQKSGFFIDQRYNRELVQKYAHSRKVLNTFCYTGGFSVYALAGGAASVDSVDSSERAVELAVRNVSLNFPDNVSHRTFACDVFDFIKRSEDQQYDMIILDPPAFAKHRKALPNAVQGYKRLNVAALTRIRKGGILFTFSCSQAVSSDLFRTTLFSAAAIAGRNVSILHQLTQPEDHPISIYHPEGEYLKGLVLYVE